MSLPGPSPTVGRVVKGMVKGMGSGLNLDSAEKPAQDFLVCFDLGFWRMSQSL
jgi:hypothetical protein